MRFAAGEMPGSYDQVKSIFQRQGAYARFKQLLETKGLLEKWYTFEAEANEKAVRQWCDEEDPDGARMSAAKAALSDLERGALIELVRDLYELSSDNKRLVHARLGLGQDPLAEYKKRQRLWQLTELSDGIGWGYHDGLCDTYYSAFPDASA